MVQFFGLKCALLHVKFQKNCWSGFRDNPGRTNGLTDGRTNGGYFIGPFGFQPGTNNSARIRRQLLCYVSSGKMLVIININLLLLLFQNVDI